MTTTADPNGVLVGLDGSPESDAALKWAIDEARLRGTSLTLMHVFPALLSFSGNVAGTADPKVEAEARAEFEALRAKAPPMDDLVVHMRFVAGNPPEELVAASKNAQLLVVGSSGRGSVRGAILGSVSLRCVVHAHCPVLVVRGEEHRG